MHAILALSTTFVLHHAGPLKATALGPVKQYTPGKSRRSVDSWCRYANAQSQRTSYLLPALHSRHYDFSQAPFADNGCAGFRPARTCVIVALLHDAPGTPDDLQYRRR